MFFWNSLHFSDSSIFLALSILPLISSSGHALAFLHLLLLLLPTSLQIYMFYGFSIFRGFRICWVLVISAGLLKLLEANMKQSLKTWSRPSALDTLPPMFPVLFLIKQLNWTELNWIELKWIVICESKSIVKSWTELVWTELIWTELVWTELNWIELKNKLGRTGSYF